MGIISSPMHHVNNDQAYVAVTVSKFKMYKADLLK